MFILPQDITIHNAKVVQTELIDYIEEQVEKKETALILDAKKVEDIDAAGLQILLSAYLTAQEEEFSFELKNDDGYLNEVLKLSGASDVLYLSKGGSSEDE